MRKSPPSRSTKTGSPAPHSRPNKGGRAADQGYVAKSAGKTPRGSFGTKSQDRDRPAKAADGPKRTYSPRLDNYRPDTGAEGSKSHEPRQPRGRFAKNADGAERTYAPRTGRGRPSHSSEGAERTYAQRTGRSRPSHSAEGAERTYAPRTGRSRPSHSAEGAERTYAPRTGRGRPARNTEGAEKTYAPRTGRGRPSNSSEGAERTYAPRTGRFTKSAEGSKRDYEPRQERGRGGRTSGVRTPRTEKFEKRLPARTATPRAVIKREPVIKALPERKGILIWGLHAVREALQNDERDCFQIWATDAGFEAISPALESARTNQLDRPKSVKVDRENLDELLPAGSVHQGVVMEVAPLEETQLYDLLQEGVQPDLVVVLDQVTDPHNIGAILRSAAAFGAGALIMTDRHAPSATGVIAKTACGAMEHVKMISVVNLVRALADLQQAGYWCVGLAEEATREMSILDLSGKTAVVLGAEGDGLRRLTREHCDDLARLPTGGPIGSLNVSNAAAVAMYEVRRQKAVVSE